MHHAAISNLCRRIRTDAPFLLSPYGLGLGTAVAHSGGADSTCLLYLLHRLCSEWQNEKNWPQNLLSLSVDHSLQPGSVAMAESCRQFSQSLHIPHVTLRVPWGSFPFPDVPVKPGPVESVARAARYRVLMDGLKTRNATVIAMGHHADDQVETLLMRLARDETEDATPTGMRNCRRWGMGTNPNGLDWVGISGMHRWIVRPLLGVPKKRILATCEQHGLNYVNDPTNFQPSLTLRNYIRYFLSNNPHWQTERDTTRRLGEHRPPVKGLLRSLQRLDTIATEVSGICEDIPVTERFYAVANHLGQIRDQNDTKATQYLRDFTRASPPSTLLLCPPIHGPLPTPEVRRAIVLRILRFVSPRPWGSPSSEASRRSTSLDLICGRLWDSSLISRKPFCAGSDVVWRPVSLRDDGRIRMVVDEHNPGVVSGWLVSRQPPIKRTGAPSPCVQDISQIIGSGRTQEFLWDNRFLLRLKPHHLPSDVLESCQTSGSVIVQPHGRWLLPKIVWLRQGYSDHLLAGFGLSKGEKSALYTAASEWADIEWIRSLEPI